MRTLNLLRWMAFLALFLSGGLVYATVDATYYFSDFTGRPLNVRRLTVTPLASSADYLGTNLSSKPIVFNYSTYPDLTNGFFTVTNMIPGYAYRATFSDGYSEPSVTNYFGTNVSGAINASDYRTTYIQWANGRAVQVWYAYLSNTNSSGTIQTNISWTSVTNLTTFGALTNNETRLAVFKGGIGLYDAVNNVTNTVEVIDSVATFDTLDISAQSFAGNGTAITDLNGSSISSGTVADARIATSIARITDVDGATNAVVQGLQLATNILTQQRGDTTNAPFAPVYTLKAISEGKPVIITSVGDSMNYGGTSMTLQMTRTLMRFFGTNGGWGARSSFNGDGYFSWGVSGSTLIDEVAEVGTNWLGGYYVATNATTMQFFNQTDGTVSANRGWVMWLQEPGAGTLKCDFVFDTTTNSITVNANNATTRAMVTNIALPLQPHKIYITASVADSKVLGAALWDTNKPSAIDYSISLGGRDNWTTGFPDPAFYTNAFAGITPTLVICTEKGDPVNEFVPYVKNLRRTWTNSDFVIMGTPADATGTTHSGNNYLEQWARTNECIYFRADLFGSMHTMTNSGFSADTTHLGGLNSFGEQIGVTTAANELLKYLGLLDNAFVSPRYVVPRQTNAPVAFRLAIGAGTSSGSGGTVTNYMFVPIEFQRTVTGYQIAPYSAFSGNTTFANGLTDMYLLSGYNLTYGTVGKYFASGTTSARNYWTCSAATFNNKLNVEARLILATTNGLTGHSYFQIQTIPVDTTFSGTVHGPGSQAWSGTLGANGSTNTFYTPWQLATLPNTNWFGAMVSGLGTTGPNTNGYIIGTQLRYY